jgi:methionyl-tRNA formyltransferase
MKAVFFGSTIFSQSVLQAVAEHCDIAGVVIVKPKPKGRGLKVTMPSVAQWAAERSVKVYDPGDPNDRSFVQEMTALKPDLFILSAYGHILNGDLLKVPRCGGVNVHPSLLPKYRGAAPIQRAIMAGEETTGVTIFFMDEKIDHGEIIAQESLRIEPDDTYGSLSERLSSLAASMLPVVIRSIEQGTCRRIRQDEQSKIYAPKVQKEETVINWNDDTSKIFNLIRSLSPSPGAKTRFRDHELTVICALPSDKKFAPASCHIVGKNIHVGTQDGSVILAEIKPENKKKISGLDFLNGFRVQEGEKLG